MLLDYDEPWYFARTEVIEDPSAATKHFRKLTRQLESAGIGFINFPREYRDDSPRDFRSDRAKYHRHKDSSAESFEVDYIHCPLPLLHLLNGTRPFVLDTQFGAKNAVGVTVFENLDEPFQRVWDVLKEHQYPSSISRSWSHAESETTFRFSFDGRYADDEHTDLKLEHSGKLEFRGPYEPAMWESEVHELLNELGLPFEPEFQIKNDHDRGFKWIAPIEITLSELATVATSLDQHFGSDTGWEPVGSLELVTRENVTPYKRVRGGRCFDDLASQLNEVHRDWFFWLRGFYHTDFDPFVDPEIIPAESLEIRIPIGKLSRSPVFFDIVHVPEGTFIELRSTKKSSIPSAAKKAKLDIEHWTGNPAQRWR